ncbi:MAG: Eco57I restriction-modification methylase domain-containing protein [Bacteroidales bacterium]|nr:Eco57I restriction-modification methylase domain-containing protein [Bacteroidales bacterium]
MASYELSLKPYIIYLMRIPDEVHRGCIKVGKAELDTIYAPVPEPNSSVLNKAAHKRIQEYTRTASIYYELKYTEAAYTIEGKGFHAFDDNTVHEILERSNIKRHDFSFQNQGREWYECSLETAIAAIKAAKEDRKCLDVEAIVPEHEEIVFRPEQTEAIDKTVKRFQTGRVMLWNAKMRFGKTLCALEVVKRCQFHRTLILTHRPVVDEQWFEDYKKIFHKGDGYCYGSRTQGDSFDWLEGQAAFIDWAHYIYFASIQDLRGAELAGGKFDKNQELFNTPWDCLIVDEAHEGTQTELGQKVLSLLTKPKTKTLSLSGTPFNLMDEYQEDEIYTWDYVDEQRAKAKWDLEHFGDPNPYAGLPRLNIFTFDLGKALSGFEDIEDSAFNFKEFFRTWTGDPERDHGNMPDGAEGKFVHEIYVRNFIDLIVKFDPESNYPFSTPEYRSNFRHSLWMVPGVREARALSEMLKCHPIFTKFEVANVAGEGDDDVPYDNAMELVKKAMGKHPEETYSITLSCGKLTTGVTVKPWTAVMMLSGSHNTDAKAYMQTIFRVQSPYTSESGQVKKECFVFDFAPDRTLKVLADTARVQTKNTASDSDRKKLGEFLNFCPVIGYNGTKMATYNVESMLEQLKRAYISRVTRNGCDDPRLYNQEMLRKLDAEALAKFKNLHAIIGATKANHASTDVDMAKSGLTNEQYEELERIQKKPKKERTPEDLAALEEAREKKKNADSAISILRGISIRLPLLMYGAELTTDEQEVTLENFASLIDDQSWEEFMPRGVTKELFAEFVPYYDPDMFRAVSRNYRDLVRAADQMAPLERTKEIARIFSYFRNPDKETVLTPWRVVNMHIGDCIGGQVFFDTDMQTEAVKPRFVDHGEVTAKVFKDPNTRILEINSKTGLYPLFMAYSVFAEKLQAYRDKHMLATDVPVQTQNQIWDDVLRNHIFVICKTEMAKSITKRTLRGFRQAKVNARYFEDLINKITNQPNLFINKVQNGINYWNNKELEENMKFNAIVGNPPYQVISHDGPQASQATPVYHYFINIARRLNASYVSMIMPARWYSGGMGMNDFRSSMLNDKRLSLIVDFPKSRDCFPTVDIAGGICYFLMDENHSGDCVIVNKEGNLSNQDSRELNEFPIFIRNNIGVHIIRKLNLSTNLSSVVFPISPFGLPTNTEGTQKASADSITLISSKGRSFIQRQKANNQKLVGQYKVMIGQLNPDRGGVSNTSGGSNVTTKVTVLEPDEVTTATYIILGGFDSRDEAENYATYIRTKFVRFLVFQTLSSMHITQSNFQFVPIQDWTKSWSDSELYRKYNLTKEEIDYIESLIKPMQSDVLFETEDTLDPQFGEFNLLEHGVKVGDHIIYTPTGTEVIVAQDNMVEVDGEIMTLSSFTARFMPHNKRSISGVCQGPKYFSYKGVSLYKIKESFLGGK